jgi:predicted transcriptional regulator
LNTDLDQNDFELRILVSRLAAVIEKDELTERILKKVRKYEYGINHAKLVKLLTKSRYQEKVMQQLVYLGLVVQTNDECGCFYHITEKGCKVLDACKS